MIKNVATLFFKNRCISRLFLQIKYDLNERILPI